MSPGSPRRVAVSAASVARLLDSLRGAGAQRHDGVACGREAVVLPLLGARVFATVAGDVSLSPSADPGTPCLVLGIVSSVPPATPGVRFLLPVEIVP